MGKNTTNNSSLPILGQLLSFIPRELVKQSVEQFHSDKWYKRVKTWDQFVFMLYGVLTGSSTLREIIKNFMLMGDKLVHCGIFSIPKRSSVSDANSRRSADVFGHLYMLLYGHYRDFLSDSYLSLKINGEVAPSMVEIFDSTVVTLFKEVFKACGRLPLDGRKKGGLKAFTKITLSERVPNFICLKAAVTNEKVFLSMFDLAKGTIAVFDKGFQKFSQYTEWTQNGVFFLTMMNKNARFTILEQRKLEETCESGVQMDAVIELEYLCGQKGTCRTRARMVAYIDPASGKRMVFLTNLMDLKAMTVCMLYKNRWTIEPLFRQLKQNFELTYFLSDSENGIKSQIWIALILNLIFTVIHKMSKEAEDFSTMVKLAAKHTASYVNLLTFLRMSTTQISRKLDNLENVQLDLFAQNRGGGFLNSS
ncbi:IS4 family transposase [Belliella sp. DSM 111904]|uniref:IS4 family transposase n=1 Tax=Belliella filtrata TaxID=2923435 RepID=A0ABS9UWR2_9BACT|nr:IS4 family transposase [Belliella filtrata]MCH7408493.1 IS4 family transposase [Belliella filtrata]